MDPNMDDEIQGKIMGDEELSALNLAPLETIENKGFLSDTDNVIRKFNRNTMWLAAGLLGTLIFGALVLALQEPYRKAANQLKEELQAGGDALVNANPSSLSKAVGLNPESSMAEINSEHGNSVDNPFAAFPLQENRPPVIEAPESTKTTVPTPAPDINQSNADSWSSVHRKDFASVTRSNLHNIRRRSSLRFRYAGVKMRLLALWHESLARSQQTGN
jgi:hypothetical protein